MPACRAGVSLEPLARSQSATLGFSVLGLHIEIGRVDMEAQHPLVHAPLHFLGGTDEAHEVDRLGTAPHAESEAILSRLLDQAAWHFVPCLLLLQWRQRVVFQAHPWRTDVYRGPGLPAKLIL